MQAKPSAAITVAIVGEEIIQIVKQGCGCEPPYLSAPFIAPALPGLFLSLFLPLSPRGIAAAAGFHREAVSLPAPPAMLHGRCYFPARAAGAHPFPPSEKDAKGRGGTALRRRFINLPHHDAFGERFPNSAAHAASNRREGSLFALRAKKSPHVHAVSVSKCRLGPSFRLRL